MKRILIADDEECIRYTFSDFLYDAGYTVDTVDSLSSCIQNLQNKSYDLLFLDIHLGPDNSLDFIENLKTIRPECAIVVITGSLNSSAITKARKYGALDYLVKPVRKPSLLYAAQKAVSHQFN